MLSAGVQYAPLWLHSDYPEEKEVLRDYSFGWPEYLKLLGPGQWQHILARHGEGGNAPTTFGTLDPGDIAILLLGVVQTPRSEWEPGKFP